MVGLAGSGLVGRSSQVGEILDALESAAHGQGRVVLLSGEPGIGKSTLINEAIQLAQLRDFSTISARCPEQEGAPPFWPWTLALTGVAESHPEVVAEIPAAVLATIATIVPTLASSDNSARASSSQFELFVAAADLIKSVSDQTPVILTIDDLHWADSSSLKLLQHVVDSISESRVLLVCAMRDTEFDIGNDLSSTLASLSRHRFTSRMSLDRLDRDETGALLAESITGPISADLLSDVYSYAEGNPFYTLELARLHEQINPGGNPEHTAIPAGIRDVVSQRLNFLPEETRHLLKLASVFGREFDIRLLAAVGEQAPLDALSMLEPAENMGVVQPMESGPMFRFSHALMREVLVASLSLSERVRFNARAAEAIENSDVHLNERYADQLAHHYRAAETLVGPEPVIKYLVIAGHNAISRLAFGEAVDFFAEAEDLHGAEKHDLTAAEIKEWSGVAMAAEGNLVGGDERVWSAFDIYEELGATESAVRAASHPVPRGANNVARSRMQRAIDMTKPDSLERPTS